MNWAPILATTLSFVFATISALVLFSLRSFAREEAQKVAAVIPDAEKQRLQIMLEVERTYISKAEYSAQMEKLEKQNSAVLEKLETIQRMVDRRSAPRDHKEAH